MSLTSLLHTARDALAAQSYGVNVTGQNITNANTEGYVRREAMLQDRILGRETYGSVEIAGLRRATDSFVEARHYTSMANSAGAEERDSQLAIVEGLFNELAGQGLGRATETIFDSFQQLSVDPGDPVARQEVLAALTDFTDSANQSAQTLANVRAENLSSMSDVVEDLNEYAVELADLSRQIQLADNQEYDAADLRDRRDLVLRKMAPLVDINVIENGDGTMLVQAAGATLVDGGLAREFAVDLDADGDARLLARRTDGTTTDITSGLAGGKLAGLKQVRDVDIKAVAESLDEFVYDFSTSLNAQHQAGFGLDGSTGLSLFDLAAVATPPQGAALSISVSADVLDQPERLATADSLATSPGSGENAKALAQLFDEEVIAGGTRTASEGYSDIVGQVGLLRHSAQRELSLSSAIEAQHHQMRESISGVSLDEEMVALTRYQRAYQAATRVLSTADEMMRELLASFR